MHSTEIAAARTDWEAERQAADARARAEAFAVPLDQIDVTKPRLFQDDSIGHYFARLRRDGSEVKVIGYNNDSADLDDES